jgi:hypothetical protein
MWTSLFRKDSRCQRNADSAASRFDAESVKDETQVDDLDAFQWKLIREPVDLMTVPLVEMSVLSPKSERAAITENTFESS